jgi:hypothetical protein
VGAIAADVFYNCWCLEIPSDNTFDFPIAFNVTASVVWWSDFLATDPEVRVLLQIFLEAVGLERGPFSLVSTNEELLVRESRE